MSLLDFFKKLFQKEKDTKEEKESIYQEIEEEIEEIHSVWDYIKFTPNSQAEHISAVVGYEEWVSMEEILRRIRELFGMDYKNDRSLYPYIKTMVDIGLIETTNVGGKKKWRKKDILIKLKGKSKKEQREEEKITNKE